MYCLLLSMVSWQEPMKSLTSQLREQEQVLVLVDVKLELLQQVGH
jgi:hypothetical protein